MQFYFGRVSGNSARSLFCLEEVQVPYERCLLDTRGGAHRQADYLALNPMGKIPALIDGGPDGVVRLWESNAINWYLVEKHPSCGLLPPSLAGRASVQRWLFFQAAHVSPACQAIFRHEHPVVREYYGVPPNPADGVLGRKELARYLPVLEEAIAGRDHLEGSFSLADIAFVPHLTLVEETGFDFSPYPALVAWLGRLRARPAWQRAAQAIFGAV